MEETMAMSKRWTFTELEVQRYFRKALKRAYGYDDPEFRFQNLDWFFPEVLGKNSNPKLTECRICGIVDGWNTLLRGIVTFCHAGDPCKAPDLRMDKIEVRRGSECVVFDIGQLR